ncbi:hypothetical protein ACN38_g10510, partial [Penicillium nordicum]
TNQQWVMGPTFKDQLSLQPISGGWPRSSSRQVVRLSGCQVVIYQLLLRAVRLSGFPYQTTCKLV